MWATDDKLACGIDVVSNLVVEERTNIRRALLHDARDEDVDHIFANDLQHLFILIKIVVLCGQYDGVYTYRAVVIRILNGYLRFGIGTQISHHLTGLANSGQLLQQLVRQIER